MLQLLLGNIGRPGGGVNALRGHANIQGGTDCGMAYHILPGYLKTPKADHADARRRSSTAVTPKPLRPDSMNFWTNTEVHGLAAQGALRQRRDARTTTSATLHPKLPQSVGRLRQLELGLHLRPHVSRGDDRKGFFSFGMNPVGIGPHSQKSDRRARRS